MARSEEPRMPRGWKKRPQKVGREEMAAELSSRAQMPMELARAIITLIFGTAGAGPVSSPERDKGIIEEFTDQGVQVTIRGFGAFRRSVYKAHASRINNVDVDCVAKWKLSFRASKVTDVLT